MPTFNDTTCDWVIRFDGVTLGELREAHGINLADIGGETYLALETDQIALTKAICFLCRDQYQANATTQQQLAARICGEVAEAAMQAIWGAAKVFFRPKLWSALQSSYETQKQIAELRPMMGMVDSLPEGMRQVVMEQVATKLQAMSGGSPPSPEPLSASGQVVTLSTPASAIPVHVESVPAA